MAINFINKALSDKFTEDTVKGAGAIKGKDGFSPIAKVKKENGKSTISITDKNGTTSAEVLDGNGQMGDTWFNVASYDIKGDGSTDNTEKLQALIDSMPSGATLYFPRGAYNITSGIILKRNINIVGESMYNAFTSTVNKNHPASIISYVGTASNVEMLTREQSAYAIVNIKNMSFYGNSYDVVDSGFKAKQGSYGHVYTASVTNNRENINGVNMGLNGAFFIDGCYFQGFSGTALTVGQHKKIFNCSFCRCNKGFTPLTYDCLIDYCWFSKSSFGIYSTATNNVGIYNTWFDQIEQHAIYATKQLMLNISGCWIDMVDYSAICVEGANLIHSRIDGRISRTGMYYAGAKSSELNADNIKYACAIYANGYESCNINITPHRRSIDGTTNTGICPSVIFGAKANMKDSIVICPTNSASALDEHMVYPNSGMLNTIIMDGAKIYKKVSVYESTLPSVFIRDSLPKGWKSMNAGDLFINSKTKELFYAKSNSADDFEKIEDSRYLNTYNAVSLGLVPNSTSDQTAKLNEILATMPNDFVLYIPRGKYKISDTLTCTKSGSIVGEKHLVYPSEQWDNNGTIFEIDATNIDDCVIDTEKMYRASISGICFRCNSYTIEEDRTLIPKGDTPVDFYTRTVNKENINCIRLCSSHSVVENCAFWGFSGYAIAKAKSNVGNYVIRNCYFNQCNIAIQTGVDSVISEITAVYCNTIVEADGSTNIITNVRGDSIAGHAFILTGNNNALSEFMIDICLYSAILIKGGHNYIDGCVGRCGAYYSGFNADDVEEVEKGSGICFEGYNANNNLINVTCPNKTLKDGNPSDKNLYTAPAIKIATKNGNPLNNEINISGEMKDEVNSDAQKAGTILSYEKLCELHGLGKGSSINERGTVINYRGVKYEFILYSRASDGSINATRVIANNIQNYNKNTKNGIVPIRLGLITEDVDGNVYISVGTNSVSDWKKL